MAILKATSVGSPPIVGVSKAIRDVLHLADQVAVTDCSVLIEGESGTGKELIARRLFAKSRRAQGSFIPVNCAGVSESLFESQFFGHVRGAFTGAEQTMLGVIRTADGGTVFLDEICEFPLALQPKLLRVLQEGEVMPVGNPVPVQVNVRFIAGSNQNLAEMVRQGMFRCDLYHRLNIVRIHLPPLRQRPEDIHPLLDHFVLRAAERYRRGHRVVRRRAKGADRLRMAGQCPRIDCLGGAALRDGPRTEVLADMLAGETTRSTPPNPANQMTLEQAERQAIVQAMESANFNRARPRGCCKSIGQLSPASSVRTISSERIWSAVIHHHFLAALRLFQKRPKAAKRG